MLRHVVLSTAAVAIVSLILVSRAEAQTLSLSPSAPVGGVLASQLSEIGPGTFDGNRNFLDNGGPPGQTFMVTSAGAATHFTFKGRGDSAGNWNGGLQPMVGTEVWGIQIAHVGAGGALTILREETATGLVGPANITDYLTFTLSSPVNLTPGNQYAFSMFINRSSSTQAGAWWGIAHTDGAANQNPYASGAAFNNNDTINNPGGNLGGPRYDFPAAGFAAPVPNNYDYVFAVQAGVPAAPKYAFTQIDYPAATSTFANGIAPGGEIVGEYTDAGGSTHAFIRSAARTFSSFDRPGAIGYTSANGMNSSGQIAGLYSVDGGTTMRAYRRTGNAYLDLIPRAGSSFTQAVSINEAGHVVGSFLDASGNPQGYLYDGTSFTTLSHPSASLTVAIGINNDEVVVGNAVIGGAANGFIYEDGAWELLQVPGASSTVAEGINDAGQITGLYTDSTGDHAFLYENGSYALFDYPEASLTWGFAVNNSQKIVGYFEDSVGAGHGFLRTPLLEGDFNSDGDVDGADLAAWSANVGMMIGVDKTKGDADADGDVDGTDLVVWQRQFKPSPAAATVSGSVPEPCMLVMWATYLAYGIQSTLRQRESR